MNKREMDKEQNFIEKYPSLCGDEKIWSLHATGKEWVITQSTVEKYLRDKQIVRKALTIIHFMVEKKAPRKEILSEVSKWERELVK